MDHPTEQYLEREELSRTLSGPDVPLILKERLDELERLYDASVHWTNPRNSPHVWLQLVGNVEQEYRGYYASTSIPLDMVLRREHPWRPYRARGNEIRTVVQWGQRKLLLMETAFLTRYGHLSDTVVYAGAARGDHVELLAWMFPNHHFHLYDPAPAWYKASGPGAGSITVYPQLFLRADAEGWAPERRDGKQALFISDVVTMSVTVSYDENRERQRRDMRWQMGWVQSMKPAMSILRFMLPWASDKPGAVNTAEYLDGEIWLQPWMLSTTTETRLVTDGRAMRIYNYLEYEQQLAHHNAVTRLSLHDHGLVAVPGLDHCRDCALDIRILREYVTQRGRPKPSVDEQVAALMVRISQRLGAILTEVMDRKKTLERVHEGQLVDGELAFEAPLRAAIETQSEYD